MKSEAISSFVVPSRERVTMGWRETVDGAGKMEWGTGVFDVVDWGDEWADEVEGCMILGCCWAWLVLEVGWLTVDDLGLLKV
ncbi:hypothetical protein Tco_0020922 [Tanacetum coccineum]